MKLSNISQHFSENTRRALKNANWIFLEKLVALPVSLLLIVVLARYLGSELFGRYSYYTALVTLVVPISALGLNAIVTREVVQNTNLKSIVIGTSLFGRLMGGCMGAIGLLLYAVLEDDIKFLLIIYLSLCQVFSAFTVFNFWFQAHQLNKYVALARLLALLFGTLLKLTIVFLDLGLRNLVLAFGLDFLFVALFMFYFYRRESEKAILKVDTAYLRQLLSQSKWLLLGGVAAAVNLRIDLIMLGNMSSDSELGLYSVAARISEIWYFIPTAITAAFFPMLLHAKAENQHAYLHKLQKLNDALFVVALAVILPVFLVSEYFVGLFFGEPFSGAATILNIHIFGGIFIFMRALLNKWLIAESLVKISMFSHVLGAIINFVCNYLLIPEYGGCGAAVASVISYAVSSYLAMFYWAETRPLAKVMTHSLLYPARLLKR